jgi:hypothetical protein
VRDVSNGALADAILFLRNGTEPSLVALLTGLNVLDVLEIDEMVERES